MPTRLLKTVTLLALTALSTLALADPPARVGRVALAQGQVSISADVGEEASAALVNWPLTSRNLVTTAANSRTDLRVGSTSIRLDGDSSLEVIELDDDSLRLRLHYGSASVRIVNPDVLAGFELTTAQARVRMQQPGRLRVDADRKPDASTVNVFEGVALVEGGGSTLTIRAGRRAELVEDDVRTAQAITDGFDEWSLARDRYAEASTSARYVTSEMTGYEDLDRYGSWRDDSEYGPLWLPSVSSTWVPYRDGRWTWLDPWGWTWVDNAPWGYAPFHYGRWVHVNKRWAWAPGRHDRHRRPVWAPALVGWVGGNGWNLAFDGRRPRAAQGWYPLAPRERFVPGYRTSDDHVKRLNDHGRNWRKDGRGDGDRGYHRRDGLTVVPHEQFGHRGGVVVPRTPKAPPLALQNAPGVATAGVAPAGPRRGELRPDTRPHRVGREPDDRGREGAGRDVRYGRDRDGRDGRDNDNRDGRDGRDRDERDRGDRSGRGQRGPVVMPPPVVAASAAGVQARQVRPQPPVAIQAPAPVPPASPQSRWEQRHEGRNAWDDGRRFRRQEPPVQSSPIVVPPPPVFAPSAPQIATPPPNLAPSTPQLVAPAVPGPAPAEQRFNRGHRGDGDGERRRDRGDGDSERRRDRGDGDSERRRDYSGGAVQARPSAPPVMAPPQVVAQPAPAPAPRPEPVRAAPPPPPVAAPAPVQRNPMQEDRARGGGEERRHSREDRQVREERR